jgi:hypothetical protein
MPEIDYHVFITEFVRILVYFGSEGKEVNNFVVKLEYYHRGIWVEVERYDCFHGVVHKDILNRKGAKKRVIRFEHLDVKSGLNVAIKDFKENYDFYIWRFTNEKE